MSDVVIECHAIDFAFGTRQVLDKITLQVKRGEIYGLVGADGAGKTTLLRLLAGQLQLNSAEIKVLGKKTSDPKLRNELAYMPQGFGLYRDLSVTENLEFFADLHDLDRNAAAKRIDSLLHRTGLNGFERRRAGQLSGGMMQKLALACALVSEPQVMFLDEPTTGVDPLSRRAFWRLLEGVRLEGVAIFYATANMDEAERCDRIGLLQHGRLMKQGTPLELLSGAKLTFVEIAGEQARQLRRKLREMKGVCLLYPVGRRLRAWLSPELTIEEFARQLATFDLRLEERKPTLHDSTLFDLALNESASNGNKQ